ncbi:hypothetical protein J2Z65_004476 [Paenibacillus aceris]|uniref:Copper amine oxidase N-terminal domain-containing protein n=2 Tax=Paenibacillus aceris TaxID=869555 RepID=A0ABS4I2V5_9BACL|nr:hypothetical protein [Paenibacillus aceris]MBP1965239.1 hypothetical protein [Paenibacillus aceris]
MGREQKNFRNKKKIVGAIASTAMLAVPFMAVPVAANTEVELPVEHVDHIDTIVIPANGTKYIDLDALRALYDAADLNITQNENEMNTARGSRTLGVDEFYEIKAGEIGKATFTVSGMKYPAGEEMSYLPFTDSFEVVVVPNTGDPDTYKFDLSNVFTMMSQMPLELQSHDKVKSLLGNVSPLTIVNDSPIDYHLDNSAPYQLNMTNRLQGVVGEKISRETIRASLQSYFGDYDYDELDVVFIDRNNPNIRIDEVYDNSHGYELTPLTAGDFDLNVLVVDHHGGMTRGIIPFHCTVNTPPQLKTDSVLAKHFSLDGVNNPIMYLSNDAEIDLSEVFFDAENSALDYEIVVEGYGSPGTAINTISLDSSPILTWESLSSSMPNGIKRIKELRAHERENTSFQSVLNVDIEHAIQDPFPASLDMYESNASGTSSYIFDYKSDVGFDAFNYTEITNADIHKRDSNAVTASVYQNVYLKFDAKGRTESLSKIKIYGHNRETQSILYQDDFNFRVISTEDTLYPETNIPAIRLRSLYPDYYNDGYWTGPYNIGQSVSVIPETYNDEIHWTYETSSLMSIRLEANVPTHTQILFKIDLDEGKRIYYVPYIPYMNQPTD